MRLLLSALGLLMAVAIVGWLVTRQLAVVAKVPALSGGAGSAASAPIAPAMPPAQQARQMQQDVKQAIEDAMRQPRPTGDEVR